MQTHWIANRDVGEPGAEIVIVNPATEEALDRIPAGSAAIAAEAAGAAKSAFTAWSRLSPIQRWAAIGQVADRLAMAREEIAELLTKEMGKPLPQSRAEIDGAIASIRSYGELAVHLRAGSQMSAAEELNFQQRVPRGVAACIVPWNYPVAMAITNAVPNLLVGNTVVLKPSEKTPLATRLMVERCFSHLPAGVMNVVLGDGARVGEPLVTAPEVDVVVFIGSERTGRRIGELCGAHLKKAILELGGKDPLIVDETVDIGAAARLAAQASFANAGQICTSSERILVAESIHDAFVAALVAEARALRLGNGLVEGVQMGPLVDKTQLAAVSLHVEDALARGGSAACGGRRLEGPGYFYPPTVLTGLDSEALVLRDETFGPIAPCQTFHDFDQAIALANDSRYGLGAIVCTTSSPRAIEAIQSLQAGMVKINTLRGKAPGATSEPAAASGLGHGYGIEFMAELTRQRSVHWRGKLPPS